MLSLLAFSAVHVNIVLAAQDINGIQTPIDHHAQSHEGQQTNHFSCTDDLHETFNHRTDTDQHDNLVDRPVAQIAIPVAEPQQVFLGSDSIQEFSRKPVTLTHNITLLI